MAQASLSKLKPDGVFQAATISAVKPVRETFARIVERKCRGPKVVTGVCEAFGVHRKLAWQVIKTAYSEDPFVAARHVPAGKGLETWLKAARDAGIGRDLVEMMVGAYLGGTRSDALLRDPRVSPIHAAAKLPPCHVVVGSADALAPQSEALVKALARAGVPHEHFVDADMPHGYAQMEFMPGARPALDRMLAFLRRTV